MDQDESRLVLYIGSSIGNFEPHQAARLLRRVRAGLEVGDAMLLGVDLVKDEATLVAAYDDAQGVTAAFNGTFSCASIANSMRTSMRRRSCIARCGIRPHRVWRCT